MKALSLTQPFASLIAIGAKTVETRGWFTSYRGPLAIHASKRFPMANARLCLVEPFTSSLSSLRLPAPVVVDGKTYVGTCVPLGFIVGVCDLVDVLPIHDFKSVLALMGHVGSPDRVKTEMAFGDYSPGRFMWFLKNARLLSSPIPAKGTLRVWDIDEAQSLAISSQFDLGKEAHTT